MQQVMLVLRTAAKGLAFQIHHVTEIDFEKWPLENSGEEVRELREFLQQDKVIKELVDRFVPFSCHGKRSLRLMHSTLPAVQENAPTGHSRPWHGCGTRPSSGVF